MLKTNNMTNTLVTCAFFLLATVHLGTLGLNAQVVISEWTGNGITNNWSDPGNWLDGAPVGGPNNNLVFANSLLQSMPTQDMPTFTIGGMFVESSTDSFMFDGGQIVLDGSSPDFDSVLEVSGPLPTVMFNDLNFTNDSGLVISNGATFEFFGFELGQANQPLGTTSVTGAGTLNFGEGFGDLSAHLQIGTGINTIFSTGPSGTVNIGNGFDAMGDVFVANSNLNFGNGGNINGNLNIGSATIQTSPTSALEVSGDSFVDKGFLRLEANSTLAGNGSLNASTSFIQIGPNAIIDKDVFVIGSEVSGESDSSMISGAVEMSSSASDLASFAGQLRMTSTLAVTGISRSSISEGASIQVDGQTTVSGFLGVDDSARLFGVGNVMVESGARIDLQGGTVEKEVNLDSGATITGMGTIMGNLNADGLVDPGNSAGTLGIDGDIVMSGTTEICIELGGTDPGRSDLIIGLSGFGDAGMNTAFLDGELIVSLIDDFNPLASDEFFFIQNLNIVGTFANTGGGNGLIADGSLNIGSGVFNVEYGTDFVRLHSFRAIPEPGAGALFMLLSAVLLIKRRRQ